MKPTLKCPYCKSKNIILYGNRKTKERHCLQRLFCKTCKRTFTKDKGFKHKHKSEEIIFSCLTLYAKGLSIRETAEFLGINKNTVLRWIHEYSIKLFSFLQKKVPALVKTLHLDELFLKMRNSQHYIWDSMDYETKFSTWFLSQKRDEESASTLVEESPSAINSRSDGLPAYKGAIRRRYSNRFYRAFHLTSIGFKKNSPIERLQNTLRAWLHKKRGFHSLRTGNIMMNFYWINYNYVRKHMSLGETPAEKAGVMKYYTFVRTEKQRWKQLISEAFSFVFYFMRLINRKSIHCPGKKPAINI